MYFDGSVDSTVTMRHRNGRFYGIFAIYCEPVEEAAVALAEGCGGVNRKK